jgi:hypothetical protein
LGGYNPHKLTWIDTNQGKNNTILLTVCVFKKGNLVMGNRVLICAFLSNPYPALYLTIVFPNVASLIKNFRIQLYYWLCDRCEKNVNALLSRISDNFRTRYQEALLIDIQNSLYFQEFAPEIFIANFDFNKCTSDGSFDQIQYQLTAYIDRKIKYQLFPILRKLVGDDSIGHSNVGLVVKASDKKVQLSLERAGYNQERKSQLMFFIRRLKQVKNSQILLSNVAIGKWDEAEYQQVADRYNEEKRQNWQSIDGARAKIMLEEIGQVIRTYERPFIEGLAVNIDAHSVEIEEIIPEPNTSFLLDLCDFIRELLARLDGRNNPQINRRIIFAILNHGFDINQADIAEEYEQDRSKQYIVSRELTFLYKEISKMYFEFHHMQPSSEKLAFFIKILKNKTVDGIKLNMPVMRRVFVDDFMQIIKLDTIRSETGISMKENIIILTIDRKYKINLDEYAKQHLSRWMKDFTTI